MPLRLWILRVVVGLMCIGFAHMLGRSVGAKARPARRGTGPLSWSIRTLLAAVALTWRGGFDWLASVAIALSVVAGILGFHIGRKPAPAPEDLSKQMFPDD